MADLSNAERVAARLKDEGNQAYRESNYEEALAKWGEGFAILKIDGKERSQLCIALRSNAAMVFLKLSQYDYTEADCNDILEIDPMNAKILARRSAAREGIASNAGTGALFDERKNKHNLAVEDLKKAIEILDEQHHGGDLDKTQKKLKEECEKDLMFLLRRDDEHYTRLAEGTDGMKHHMISGFADFANGRTPLPENPRIPMPSMKEEMLAVRLLMCLETTQTRKNLSDGIIEELDFQEEGRDVLNKILTTVAQVPYCLFPATGSNDKSPPITVHLLAFYMRVCLSEKAKEKFGIEDFCKRATEHIISDKEAYAIATFAYKEIEEVHSPLRGHAKTFINSSKGPCMPCSFRLTREGKDDWGAGLQQATHFGRSEWVAFCLNRMIEKIDGGKLSVVDAILERDSAGCNSMMHAANDTNSGFSSLSIRMMVAATSYSTPDVYEKEKAVCRILNTFDNHSYSPALAAASLINIKALEVFSELGAKLLDSKVNGRISQQAQQMLRMTEQQLPRMNPQVGSLIRAIQNGGGIQCCNYCGNSPENLCACGGCGFVKYCNRDCQKKGYKKHKLVCTTAKQSVVSGDAQWYSDNISTPRP